MPLFETIQSVLSVSSFSRAASVATLGDSSSQITVDAKCQKRVVPFKNDGAWVTVKPGVSVWHQGTKKQSPVTCGACGRIRPGDTRPWAFCEYKGADGVSHEDWWPCKFSDTTNAPAKPVVAAKK